MGKLALKGLAGEVRWSYRLAASLREWSLNAEAVGDAVRQSLTATVASHDARAVSQQPLVFVVPRPSGQPWRWPIESLQIVDGTLTAVLGPQE